MAQANATLVRALQMVAARLRQGEGYQWGHFGQCNCGHLAQVLTGRDPHEIHRAALARGGDWDQRARDYCPTSGYPIDELIRLMLEHGLSTADLGHLEQLDDAAVLRALPSGRRHLRRNDRDDVIEYLETWANVLAASLRQSADESHDPADVIAPVESDELGERAA